MVFGKDIVAFFGHYKFLASETLRLTGELPFWDPFVFSGAPFLGNGQEALFYPLAILFYLLPLDFTFGISFLVHCIIGGIGIYLLMGVWGLSPFSSFVSALAFMFSLKYISGIYAGHLSLFIQTSWAPFAFLFLELTIRKGTYGYALLTGLVLSLAYLAGHIQVLFYLSFLLLLYLVFNLFYFFRSGLHGKSLKVVLLFFLIFVTCATLSSIQLLPFLEGVPYLLRAEGVDYTGPGQNTLRPKDLFRILLPHYWGSPDTVLSGGFSNHLFETEVYAGILPLILSVIALFGYKKDTKILFWGGMALFTILFSLGKHTFFYPLFHSYVPGFGLFKTPPRMLWLYALSIAILAGFGTSILCDVGNGRNRKVLVKVLIGLGIICVFTLYVMVLFDKKAPGLILFFSLTIISLLLIAINLKFKEVGWVGKSLLVITLLADLWFHGMPLLKTIDPQIVFPKTITATFVNKVEGEFRVLDLANDARQKIVGRFHIQSLSGYSSSILKHYAEFYGLIWNLNLSAGIVGMPRFPIEAIQNRHLLNLLNARFITTEKLIQFPGLQLVFSGKYQFKNGLTKSVYIYENQEVLPRAFVVRNAKVVKQKSRIFDSLRKFDPKETVILEENFDRLSHPGKFQIADITSYQPNRINLRVNLDNPGFLVLGDVWSPGWRAFDNGEEKSVFKANYALRSIFLEKGEHQVDFIYDPMSYRIGKMVSLISILGLLAYGVFTWRRNKALKEDGSTFGG